jgi:hypothetical protein
MSQGKDDLPEKLNDWLRREGYPFEMRVAQSFRKAGFHITQSDYYTDPETNTPREIDVVATAQRSTKDNLIFRIMFLIECKSSTDKPWLLFCGPEKNMAAPGRVAQRLASKIGMLVFHELANDKSVQQLALFSLRAPVGYGLTQTFKKDKDLAYAATCGIGNAAKAAAIRWNSHPHRDRIVELIFPVIAIDGRLFQSNLDETGEISVTEITWATLVWRNAMPPLSTTIIDVQTRTSIDSFAAQSFEAAHTLLTDYYDLVDRAFVTVKKGMPR